MNKLVFTALPIFFALSLGAQAKLNELGLGVEYMQARSSITDRNAALSVYYRRVLTGPHTMAATLRWTQVEYSGPDYYGDLNCLWLSIGYAYRWAPTRWFWLEPYAGLELRSGRDYYTSPEEFVMSSVIDKGRSPYSDRGLAGALRAAFLVGRRTVLSAEGSSARFFNNHGPRVQRLQVGVGWVF
jgi:hypothetical protein